MVSGSDAIVNLSPVIESEKAIHSYWQHLFQTQNFRILYTVVGCQKYAIPILR